MMRINMPDCGTLTVDLNLMTPLVLSSLVDCFTIALAKSTEEQETRQLEKALSDVERALSLTDGPRS